MELTLVGLVFLSVALFGLPPISTPSPTPMGDVPTPEPVGTPLHEIGHVKATVCGEIVTHANNAIYHVFRNDHAIVSTIQGFRTLDFDSASARTQSMNKLTLLATNLRDETAKGQAQVKALRELDAKTHDPLQKRELAAFSDALGGVLARQQSAARDIDGFLNFYGYDDPSEAVGEAGAPFTAPTPMGVGISTTGKLPHDARMSGSSNIPTPGPERLGQPLIPADTPGFRAQEHADALVKLGVAINDDETEAAKHSTGLLSRC